MGPFWWEQLVGCDVSSPLKDASPLNRRIVYDVNDGAARDLAERLVGLRIYERAVGLTGDALARARRGGADAGYVVSLDSRSVDPCRDLQALVDGVRWLDPGTIVSLVETRLHAVVRRGRAGAIAEWDGGLVVAGQNGPR
jgi:hypothetical protein